MVPAQRRCPGLRLQARSSLGFLPSDLHRSSDLTGPGGGGVTELLPAAWPPARKPAQGSLEACWPPLFPDSWQLLESAACTGATQLWAGLRRAQCLEKQPIQEEIILLSVLCSQCFCFLHKKQGQQTSKLKNFPLVSLNKDIEIPKLTS